MKKLLRIWISGLLFCGFSAAVIAATLISVAVTPASSVANIGQAQQFTATGILSDGTTRVLTSGTFSATTTVEDRRFAAATRLTNGKILVVGGQLSGTGITATAELYDPATNTASATSSMVTARRYHTATLLGNGKVLVAGGENSSGVITATAELYDPATGSFSTTGSLITARAFSTATLLPNGKVLVAGGMANFMLNQAVDTVEIYDPVTATFSVAGTMSISRVYHTATLLGNGKVLMAGGGSAIHAPSATAELYDPVTSTFSATGTMAEAKGTHTATLLTNGKVMIAGGFYLIRVSVSQSRFMILQVVVLAAAG